MTHDRERDEVGVQSGASSLSGGDDESPDAPKRRRPGTSAGSRRSGTRAPSVVPFDPNADPGDELDPTVVTMATLCDDIGQGRISNKAVQIMTNHTAWRIANREKRTHMKAAMEAKKYGGNVEDEDRPPHKTSAEDAGPLRDDVSSDAAMAGPSASIDKRTFPQARRADDDFDYTQDLATSRYNVQVRIGANGETIIDEESLFVNRNEEEDTEHYTHVEESDTTKFVNSLTYSKKLRGSRWSAEETELFYDVSASNCLLTIAYVFPI